MELVSERSPLAACFGLVAVPFQPRGRDLDPSVTDLQVLRRLVEQRPNATIPTITEDNTGYSAIINITLECSNGSATLCSPKTDHSASNFD
jgi:hypothetical protein